MRIGGVPEHFNLPWHLVREEGSEREPGVAFEWRDYSTGTGAMLADLAGKELDLAILLTEGAALGVARKLPIRALSLYTTSPLIWGVHVAPGSRFRSIGELRGARFAISRHGSGSHLMSLALALEQGWETGEIEFVAVDNLPGAVQAFRNGEADVFLWEHFTTAPEVEGGRFRRIGDFSAPWPAWVICAGEASWSAHRDRLEALIRLVGARAARLRTDSGSAALIADRYGLRRPAVEKWLELTAWTDRPEAPDAALDAATRMLESAGAI